MDRSQLWILLALVMIAFAAALGWDAINLSHTARQLWQLRVDVAGSVAAFCAAMEMLACGCRTKQANQDEALTPRNSAKWTLVNARESR